MSATEDAETAPLTLSPAQWETFMEGGLLHPILARWIGQRALEGQGTPAPLAQLFDQALNALHESKEAARKWPRRFGSERDLTAWAALCLLHEGLPRDAAVHSLLEADEVAAASVHDLCQAIRALHLESTP